MCTFAFLCTGIIKHFFDFNRRETFTSSCVCFGLSPAPKDFTKLIKSPIAISRRIQIRIIIYLDMLLTSQTINGLEITRNIL